MDISILIDMGEFEIIEGVRKLFERTSASGAVRVGIGDDCCVLAPREGTELAVSTDTLVEDVHFRMDYFSYRQVGARAMAAALSDLAAVAASPLAALVAVSLKKELGGPVALDLAEGLAGVAEKYGCPITGGDLTASPGPLVITVTVIGETPRGRSVLRAGAQPGDEVWVTGRPGEASAVLAFLEAGRTGGSKGLPRPGKQLEARFFSPEVRLEEAALLRDAGPPSAMIDISDGLAADLGHILKAAHAGARLFAGALPVSRFAGDMARKKGLPPEYYLLHGGEDFELCLTVRPGSLSVAAVEISRRTGTELTLIGRVTDRAGIIEIEREDGSLETVEPSGFDHFI